jgi:PAS domain-containing protein
MADHEWVRAFPGAVTVCDRDGIILEMNDRSVASFAEEGGAALIGTNALDCHPEPSRGKLGTLLKSGETNVYTIEKRGVKKRPGTAMAHTPGLSSCRWRFRSSCRTSCAGVEQDVDQASRHGWRNADHNRETAGGAHG